MSNVALRLAGPLQSWSGYRHLLDLRSSVPTEAVPRKSAINGLIGAALGPVDGGFGSARDLDAIGARYSLHVRVEARNTPIEDFQTVGPLHSRDTARAERMLKIGSASVKAFPSKRSGGNFETAVSRRDYLSHTEFIVALDTDEATAVAWLRALREPVFMPYLGRKSCAPTFPFILGVFDGAAEELFAVLPHVEKYRADAALQGYAVTGDYNLHVATPHARTYSPPVSEQRSDQLDWTKEKLR